MPQKEKLPPQAKVPGVITNIISGKNKEKFGTISLNNTIHQESLKVKLSLKTTNKIERLYSGAHRPCRGICSTVHNPAFHRDRFGYKRGTSAGKKKEKDEVLLDWKDTKMNEEVNRTNVELDSPLKKKMFEE